jgi:hypothetical protein
MAAAPGRAFNNVRLPSPGEPVNAASRVNPNNLTLRLPPIKAIQLRLIDMQKRPVAGAQIKFVWRRSLTPLPGEPRDNWAMLPTLLNQNTQPLPALPTQVRSDAQGRAMVPFGAAGDEILVGVSAPGLQTVYTRLLVPGDSSLTLRMPPGATLRGRLVRGANKAPVAGARIMTAYSYSSGGATTDAQGRFVLHGLDEGEDTLLLRASGLVMPSRQVKTKRGAVQDIGQVVASPGCVLTGHVKPSKPANARRMWMMVQSTGNGGPSRFSTSTSVGADGRYRLRVPPGKYSLQVIGTNQSARKTYTLQAREGGTVTTNIDLTKVGSGAPAGNRATPVRRRSSAPEPERLAFDTVIGKVVMQGTGEPVAGATVTLHANGEKLQTTTSNKRGDFVFGRLPDRGSGVPRQYILNAQAPPPGESTSGENTSRRQFDRCQPDGVSGQHQPLIPTKRSPSP